MPVSSTPMQRARKENTYSFFVLGESNFRTDPQGHGVAEHYDILIENHTNLIERSITVSLRTPTTCEN